MRAVMILQKPDETANWKNLTKLLQHGEANNEKQKGKRV